MTSVAVLLVTGDVILREGLRALLGQKPGVKILGEAGEGHKAVDMARDLKPDIAILSVDLVGLNGIETTKRIRAEVPGTRVLALSRRSDRRSISRMLGAGASGYILKDSTSDDLWEAIETLMSNRVYLGAQALSVVVKDYLATREQGGTPELTPRELEVLQLIAEGKRTKEIAVIIGVSAKTVETHRKHIMDKLGIHSIASLTKYALREGLTTLED